MLIQRLGRFINRRSKPQAPRGFLVTGESELRAIAAEASAWSIETGGDLFGRWHDVPTVLLASKAGPAAKRWLPSLAMPPGYAVHIPTLSN
jgi:hypothetical protein